MFSWCFKRLLPFYGSILKNNTFWVYFRVFLDFGWRAIPKFPQNPSKSPLSESVSIPQRSSVIPLSHRKYQTKKYRHRASRNIKNDQNQPNNKKVRADWSKKSFSKTWIIANARFQWKPYVNLASGEKVQVSDGSFRVPKVQKKLIFPKIKFRTQKYTLWANFDENIKGIEAGFFSRKKSTSWQTVVRLF